MLRALVSFSKILRHSFAYLLSSLSDLNLKSTSASPTARGRLGAGHSRSRLQSGVHELLCMPILEERTRGGRLGYEAFRIRRTSPAWPSWPHA